MTPHAIDVHTHIVPAQFPAYIGRNVDVPWPSMAPAQACHCHVMIRGKVYRTVHQSTFTLEDRMVDMDRTGIEMQCLSPMPELLSCWLPAEDAQILCRYLIDQIAEMVTGGISERHPGLRICFSHGGGAFVGMVPRLSRAWHLNKPARESLPCDPAEYAKRFWYDSIMFDPGLIAHLASRFGATQVVADSDYPFTLGDPDPVATPTATAVDAATRDNALRFLGRP